MPLISSTIRQLATLITLLGISLSLPRVAQASFITYDADQEFGSANTGGVWSYGFENNLGGKFHEFTKHKLVAANNNIDSWQKPNDGDLLGVYHPTSGQKETFKGMVAPENQLLLYPGAAGQYVVVRFTAPATSFYGLNYGFSGLDKTGTTTGVFVLINGYPQYFDRVDSAYSGGTPGAGPHGSVGGFLNQGDQFDFLVGYDDFLGGAPDNTHDATGLKAKFFQVAPIPEPGTWLLMAVGLGGLYLYTRRKSLVI